MPENTPQGDLNRIVPDQDDIRRRSKKTSSQRTSPVEPRKKRNSLGSAKSSKATIGFAIMSGVVAFYLLLQQHSSSQMQKSYEERLSLADERIVRLEQALTQTDESVAFNGTAINAQFKAVKAEADLQMSEIRKLWDVSNKRNRNWIEENQVTLAAQSKSVASLTSLIDELKSSQQSNQQRLSQLSTQLEAEKLALKKIQEQSSVAFNAAQDYLQANIEERLLSLAIAQENSASNQGLSESQQQQINEIMDSFRAIDAGRLETNKRLNALTERINSLSTQVNSLSGQ